MLLKAVVVVLLNALGQLAGRRGISSVVFVVITGAGVRGRLTGLRGVITSRPRLVERRQVVRH